MTFAQVRSVVLVVVVTVTLVAGQDSVSPDRLNKLSSDSGQTDARTNNRWPLPEISDLESYKKDMLDERIFRTTILARLDDIQRAISAENDVDAIVDKRVKRELRLIESQLTCNFTKQLEEVRHDLANLSHTVHSAMASSKQCPCGNSQPQAAASTAAAPAETRRIVRTQLNGTINFDKCIWGLALWKSMLYVGRLGTTTLDVLDESTWNVRSNLTLPGARCINDMASCPACDILYAADSCNNEMHVVDQHGVIAHWSTIDKTHGISVNSHMNVIVVYDKARKIREFTRYGEIVREIDLPEDVQNPSHAVEISGGRYIVSHGPETEVGPHRIIVVNRTGHILQQYGGNPGSGIGQLNVPIRLAVTGGYLFAADMRNSRILLFNPAPLSYIRRLTDTQRSPVRFAVKEDGSQLYVSHNNYNSTTCLNGNVNVYNIIWM